MLVSEKKIVAAYSEAPDIIPPESLPGVFFCEKQTHQTQANLVYSWILLNKSQHIQEYYSIKTPLISENSYQQFTGSLQLFSVPIGIFDNCHAYTARSYTDELIASPNTPLLYQGAWGNRYLTDLKSHGYVRLESNQDFRCKYGFEKIYEYERDHTARQWGDGTTLHKIGKVENTQTPVLRVIDPHHPYITQSYGKVKAIWVKPYADQASVPEPYLRFQSTRINQNYAYVGCASEFSVSPLAKDSVPKAWRQKINSPEVIVKLIADVEFAQQQQKSSPRAENLSDYMDTITEEDGDRAHDLLKQQVLAYIEAKLSISVYCAEHKPTEFQRNLYAMKLICYNNSTSYFKNRLKKMSPMESSYKLAELKLRVIQNMVVELYQIISTEPMAPAARMAFEKQCQDMFSEVDLEKVEKTITSNRKTNSLLHTVLNTTNRKYMYCAALVILGSSSAKALDSTWPLAISLTSSALIGISGFFSSQEQTKKANNSTTVVSKSSLILGNIL